MKRLITIWLLSILAVPVFGQTQGLFHSEFEQSAFQTADPVQILYASNPAVDLHQYNEYESEMAELLTWLEEKSERWSDERLVEKLFFTLHRKQLKWYENYVSYPDIFTTGKYDCVTGTALFSMMLDQLDIPYQIYEFDYHVFVIADADGKQILLEATDPYNGVVTDPEEIDRRIKVYAAGADPASEMLAPVGSNTPAQSSHINNQINLTELSGLLYFNLAVKAFNDSDRENASILIEKAYRLYPSERITDIRSVFTQKQQLLSLR